MNANPAKPIKSLTLFITQQKSVGIYRFPILLLYYIDTEKV